MSRRDTPHGGCNLCASGGTIIFCFFAVCLRLAVRLGGGTDRGGVLIKIVVRSCRRLTAREQPLARPGHAHKPSMCGCCALSRGAGRLAAVRARASSCGGVKARRFPTFQRAAHHIFSPSSSRELRTSSGDSHLGVCIQGLFSERWLRSTEPCQQIQEDPVAI